MWAKRHGVCSVPFMRQGSHFTHTADATCAALLVWVHRKQNPCTLQLLWQRMRKNSMICKLRMCLSLLFFMPSCFAWDRHAHTGPNRKRNESHKLALQGKLFPFLHSSLLSFDSLPGWILHHFDLLTFAYHHQPIHQLLGIVGTEWRNGQNFAEKQEVSADSALSNWTWMWQIPEFLHGWLN